MARRKWTRQEVTEFRLKHGDGFYFNPEDSNIFVPKARSFGWTLNLSHPLSWVIVAILIGIIVWGIARR